MKPKHRIVLPETREALLNLFPAAFENKDYLGLLEQLYKPADQTVRLFPVGGTYLSLSRKIRKALMKGCYEFDLAAAQLTLAGHVWEVPSLQEQVP